MGLDPRSCKGLAAGLSPPEVVDSAATPVAPLPVGMSPPPAADRGMSKLNEELTKQVGLEKKGQIFSSAYFFFFCFLFFTSNLNSLGCGHVGSLTKALLH